MLTHHGKAQHWTLPMVWEALRHFFYRHHRPPSRQEWSTGALPSRRTTQRVLGPLAAVYAQLQREYGETPQTKAPRASRWKPQEMLVAIQSFFRETQRWPETFDFRERRDLPHPVTVMRAFGTLAEARRQAGATHGGHEGHGGSGRGGGQGHYAARRRYEPAPRS